jgi:hypothetical protein
MIARMLVGARLAHRQVASRTWGVTDVQIGDTSSGAIGALGPCGSTVFDWHRSTRGQRGRVRTSTGDAVL